MGFCALQRGVERSGCSTLGTLQHLLVLSIGILVILMVKGKKTLARGSSSLEACCSSGMSGGVLESVHGIGFDTQGSVGRARRIQKISRWIDKVMIIHVMLIIITFFSRDVLVHN